MESNRINIVTYNLHGLQENDEWRFGKIAYELNKLNAHICGFQEVINGNGVEDTSYQIAYHLRNITGCSYKTHWLYCHHFNEIYPEGLSVLSPYNIEKATGIDLNKKLSCKITPLMPRFALSCEIEIFNKKILFTTLHLDHHKNRNLRTSQAKKLLNSLEEEYNMEDYICSVITGDFNDLDKSPCLKYLEKEGYKDSYREIHEKWGNTFHSSRPTVRIDYILIKGSVKIEDSKLILYDNRLSDHIGIMTSISFPPEKTEKKTLEEEGDSVLKEKKASVSEEERDSLSEEEVSLENKETEG